MRPSDILKPAFLRAYPLLRRIVPEYLKAHTHLLFPDTLIAEPTMGRSLTGSMLPRCSLPLQPLRAARAAPSRLK